MNNLYRNHKDNVFCMLYRDKANLLELYNAMNGTSYSNTDDLTIVTLPGAICMKYRNDAAYTIGSSLYLYEQQSTDNPNIPLRLLHYVSEEYRAIVQTKKLHSKTPVSIPTPHFVVFYNGREPQPERKVYHLSDLYKDRTTVSKEGRQDGADGEEALRGIRKEAPELELTVTVLNINEGNNPELLTKCNTLSDYMKFVNKVREKQAYMTIENAVRESVEECIRENILKDFFMEHKAEVIDMSIWEYDEELARQAAVEDGQIIGIERGMQKGLEQGLQQGRQMQLIQMVCRKLVKSKTPEEIAEALDEDPDIIRRICKLAEAFAPEYDTVKIWEAYSSET